MTVPTFAEGSHRSPSASLKKETFKVKPYGNAKPRTVATAIVIDDHLLQL